MSIVDAGKRLQFSGPITIFVLLAFVAGFLDAVTLTQVDVYVTMSTGNLLRGIIAFSDNNFRESFFAFSMVFANTMLGGLVSSFVFERFHSKFYSFFILSILEILACLVTGFTLVFSEKAPTIQKEFSLLALAVTNGAMLFWGMKLGFSYAVHTVTLLKISEAGYKLFRSIFQGGQKLRGDVFTVLAMMLFFIVGSSVGIHITRAINFAAFFCLVPIHLFMIVYLYYYTKRLGILYEEEVRYEPGKAQQSMTSRPVSAKNVPQEQRPAAQSQPPPQPQQTSEDTTKNVLHTDAVMVAPVSIASASGRVQSLPVTHRSTAVTDNRDQQDEGSVDIREDSKVAPLSIARSSTISSLSFSELSASGSIETPRQSTAETPQSARSSMDGDGDDHHSLQAMETWPSEQYDDDGYSEHGGSRSQSVDAAPPIDSSSSSPSPRLTGPNNA
eukprot:gene16006-11453_t